MLWLLASIATGVQLTSDTPGSKIWFTVDGSSPLTNGRVFEGGFSLVSRTAGGRGDQVTVRAIATKTKHKNSDEMLRNITVTLLAPAPF